MVAGDRNQRNDEPHLVHGKLSDLIGSLFISLERSSNPASRKVVRKLEAKHYVLRSELLVRRAKNTVAISTAGIDPNSSKYIKFPS